MKEAGATHNDHSIPHTDNPDRIFKHLFELVAAAVYICDKDGFITFYNKSAADLWGREPVIGKDRFCGAAKTFTSDGDPLPPGSCPTARVLQLASEIPSTEIIIERPNGTRINVLPHPKPFFDDHGNLLGAVNTLEDVTQRKKDFEKAAMLGAIVHSSNAAIISKTLNGIVTSWNPSAQQIFGYTPEEMIGQPIIKLIPHDLHYEEEIILAKLGRGEMIEYMETKRLTKFGNLIDIALTVSPVKDGKGKIIGVSKIARDVTSIKMAERTITEANERFRMAVEATKLGTWTYFPVEQDLTWSGETRKIYGLSDHDTVDYSTFLKHIYPDDYNMVTSHVEKALEPSGNGQYDVVFRIIRKDGNIRWVRTQGKVYFNTQRIPERFIGTVLDVTEDKNKNEELERQVSERTRELKIMNKQLQRSNSDLAQFASVASHDLQEPLRKVQMYCDRILQEPHNKAVYDKFLPRIIAASSRMSQLIKDVLHYAQIPDGTEVMEDVDLNNVFDTVVSDFEVMIKEKNARVTADHLPPVRGNETQLRQLFANLINNSIKFSSGTPEIHITGTILRKNELLSNYKNVTESYPYVELKFTDNGVGFEQKYATQVFEIFQRLQDRSVYGGTGIGLAVCKKIVENHHGIINVVSEPGVGSTFTVLLPAL